MKYRYASSALLIHVSLLAAPASALFVPASRNVRAVHHFANHRERTTRRSAISMFLEGSKIAAASDLQTTDYTKLGTLTVPSVGIGTISWSSDSLTELENLELQSLVQTACTSNAAFFDTAERYGSHIKTAIGMGWGETERLTRTLLSRSSGSGIVATKFTPSPWRTSIASVVEACEQSCERLGVEQIDLYQLHMPDIVQPFRAFGFGESKDEMYWDGLAECYHLGLVKNVGVCNYGPSLLTKCHTALAKRGVPLASNQIAYSLIGRHNGAQETLNKGKELGIATLASFPFAMGLLTGKYTSKSSGSMAKDTLTSLTSSKKSKFEERDLKKYAQGDGKSHTGVGPVLQVMEDIAQIRGKTIAQVALNYIICKGAIPIPGARSNAQVRDNLGSMGWRLILFANIFEIFLSISANSL